MDIGQSHTGALLQAAGIGRMVCISFVLGCLSCCCCGAILYSFFVHYQVFIFPLALYTLIVHVCFHMGEFLVAAWYRPHDICVDSFMILHSKHYVAASLAAYLEFTVKWFLRPYIAFMPFVPGLWTSILFGVLTLFFYLVRVLAMVQCGTNFSLQIEGERRAEHQLITSGIYSILRHPSYFGWFWRTLFAQLILGNTLCFAVHTALTWFFFKHRIAHEEGVMSRDTFFGQEYRNYRKGTIVGIPFL